MKDINNYIQEKLYIGKGFSNTVTNEKVAQDIINVTGVLLMHRDIDNYIKDWVKKNYVNEVKYYVTKEVYDILDKDYEVDENLYLKKMIIDDDKVDYISNKELDEKKFDLDYNVIEIKTCSEGLLYTGGYPPSPLFTILVYKVK